MARMIAAAGEDSLLLSLVRADAPQSESHGRKSFSL
jgi:hypothetical protein